MDLPFNPLDYATEFVFVDGDEVDVVVTQMSSPDKWMIKRQSQVLTVDGMWLPLADLNPGSPVDVALVGHDRDRALVVAHGHAIRSHTRR